MKSRHNEKEMDREEGELAIDACQLTFMRWSAMVKTMKLLKED